MADITLCVYNRTVCRTKKPVRGCYPKPPHLGPHQGKGSAQSSAHKDRAQVGLILSCGLWLHEFWVVCDSLASMETAGLSLTAPVTPGFSQSHRQILSQPGTGLGWPGMGVLSVMAA